MYEEYEQKYRNVSMPHLEFFVSSECALIDRGADARGNFYQIILIRRDGLRIIERFYEGNKLNEKLE